VFEDQALHFPHDMRGNAAIPTKAHWIEPEFAFTLRTPNVDVGRLCALVGVKVKSKSADSEYRWHPFKVLPLGHVGKFCSGQGGYVTAILVRQRPLPRPASPGHLCPTSLFTSPCGENLISCDKTAVRNHPTRGVFFAGCRTGSHGAAPPPLPVSIRFGSGGSLAAGFGLPHEPHARRHDRKAVEMGAEQAAKIGAIEG
jgi:hypothetical protein